MISKLIIDEPQEYKLKGRKYSDHTTFTIDIDTKTKHFEVVGKSVWKINENWLEEIRRVNAKQNTKLWLEHKK